MKTHLLKMNEEEFDQYMEYFIPDYAKDLSDNFVIPMEKALEESKNVMETLFPEKQDSADQYICNIYSLADEKNVGVI